MKIMRFFVLAAAMAGVLPAVVTSQMSTSAADASSCQCHSWQNFWGQWVHAFRSGASLAYDCGGSAGECHVNAADGLCSANHPGCGGLAAAPLRLEDVRHAAHSSTQLAQVLSRSDVLYNAERQMLHVLSCSGAVTVSVPVSAARYAAVAGV